MTVILIIEVIMMHRGVHLVLVCIHTVSTVTLRHAGGVTFGGLLPFSLHFFRGSCAS